jgi:hypothetical protein
MVVIVIEAEEPYVVIFFWRKRFEMQTMRVPVGSVPQNKNTQQIYKAVITGRDG